MAYSAHRLTDLDTHSELMLHHILKKAAQYTIITSEENIGVVLQQCAQSPLSSFTFFKFHNTFLHVESQ